jgi:hypothetical protein
MTEINRDYLRELYEIARKKTSNQNKHWTTSKGFEEDKMLIKQKFPFVPLVIPQYKKT